jgi:hypothetical protein
MLTVKFVYPDGNTKIYNLDKCRPYGMRVNNSRPLIAMLYDTQIGLLRSVKEACAIKDRIYKSILPALHPTKGKIEIKSSAEYFFSAEELQNLRSAHE